MLVLGTTRAAPEPGRPSGTMGPVARACLRLAQCPVVVVAPVCQPPARREDEQPVPHASRPADPAASILAPAAR
jgi:hypothetical protein